MQLSTLRIQAQAQRFVNNLSEPIAEQRQGDTSRFGPAPQWTRCDIKG
jgi:hypothetical protein